MTLQSLLSARVPGSALPGIQMNTMQVSQDPRGARIKVFLPKYSNVPARITDPDSDTTAFFERNGLQISHAVYIGSPGGRAVTLSVSQGDQIVWGSRVFEVVGVRHPDQLRRYFIIGCYEKTPGLVQGFP